MTTRIRPIRSTDYDQILALEAEIFGSEAWPPEVFSAELEYPGSHYLVAEADHQVIGYAGLRVVGPGDPGDIQTLAVASDYRGQGVGRALLDGLLSHASELHVSDVFLEVRADNQAAQALYQSRGFREITRRPGYYQPDHVDAIVMRGRVNQAPSGENQ